YWETVGNPAGTPVVWLHGGPGSGSTAGIRRSFDPAAYRAVVFDQRGSGRSRPLADTAAADLTTNTTQHVIGDIELLRTHLGIERWVDRCQRRTATLALPYPQRHPEQAVAMVLADVTSGTRRVIRRINKDM